MKGRWKHLGEPWEESGPAQPLPVLTLLRWLPSLQKPWALEGSLRLYPLLGFDFSWNHLGLRGFGAGVEKESGPPAFIVTFSVQVSPPWGQRTSVIEPTDGADSGGQGGGCVGSI